MTMENNKENRGKYETSKLKPSKKSELLKKSNTFWKKGVAADERQPMENPTTTGPERENKKDDNASGSCIHSEETNCAKVDATKESRSDMDSQKFDVLLIDCTDCKEVDEIMNSNFSEAMVYLAKYKIKTRDLQSKGNKNAVQYTRKNGMRNDFSYECERNGACL